MKKNKFMLSTTKKEYDLCLEYKRLKKVVKKLIKKHGS